MCSTPAALACCTNSAPPVPFIVRMAEAGGAPWPNVSSDCATDLTAAVLMPSALSPVISCRRDIPWSRYCLISSFMDSSSPSPMRRAGGMSQATPAVLGTHQASTTTHYAKGEANALSLPRTALHWRRLAITLEQHVGTRYARISINPAAAYVRVRDRRGGAIPGQAHQAHRPASRRQRHRHGRAHSRRRARQGARPADRGRQPPGRRADHRSRPDREGRARRIHDPPKPSFVVLRSHSLTIRKVLSAGPFRLTFP